MILTSILTSSVLYLQDVGCDGIAGSGTQVDQCGVCGGDNKSCRIISGIFTRAHLKHFGYNTITTIPAGACNINITELARSRNYLGKYCCVFVLSPQERNVILW